MTPINRKSRNTFLLSACGLALGFSFVAALPSAAMATTQAPPPRIPGEFWDRPTPVDPPPAPWIGGNPTPGEHESPRGHVDIPEIDDVPPLDDPPALPGTTGNSDPNPFKIGPDTFLRNPDARPIESLFAAPSFPAQEIIGEASPVFWDLDGLTSATHPTVAPGNIPAPPSLLVIGVGLAAAMRRRR